MSDLMQQEPFLRLGSFLTVWLSLCLIEALRPRRNDPPRRWRRWTANLGLVAIDSLLLRLLFPAAAVGSAVIARQQGWGVLPGLDLPAWLLFLITILALDFLVWAQHVLFHAVPALWRLHRVHHSDTMFDATTGLRFHPLEILFSMVLKTGVIVVLGAPPAAVLMFEILLNATSLFNHGNIELPRGLDRWLRLVLVTPDMHRVHHSWYPDETNSNFGFNLPWWDRLLGTYQARPRDGHRDMTLGINLFRRQRDGRLDRLLWQPLQGPTHSYPINQREEPAATSGDAD